MQRMVIAVVGDEVMTLPATGIVLFKLAELFRTFNHQNQAEDIFCTINVSKLLHSKIS